MAAVAVAEALGLVDLEVEEINALAAVVADGILLEGAFLGETIFVVVLNRVMRF